MRCRASFVVLTALAAGLVTGAGSAAAGPGESAFVSRANTARTQAGRPAYAVAADLVAVARRHAARMAAKGDIWHNPNLDREVANWRAVGENVGTGPSVDAIHAALMNSPSHRANIVDRDFTQIGVGTATDASGKLYVAQVFRQPLRTAARAPRSAPARTRTTAARPVARAQARPPGRASTSRPAPARPEPAALLATRLRAAAASARRTPVTGALDRAVSYVTVLRTLR